MRPSSSILGEEGNEEGFPIGVGDDGGMGDILWEGIGERRVGGKKMADYRVISSDNHIMEPPDLWLERMEPGFRDQAPADPENSTCLD